MQRKIISLFLLISFVLNTLLPYTAQAAVLPSPTQLVGLSQGYSLPTLRGLKINPKNPLNMEFIIDPGTDGKVDQEKASLLIKYFLAALTIPQENLWVNLSTYEQNRVIPPSLSQTDLGADMLAQDYILKQVAASITYPESEIGKKYWDKLNNIPFGDNSAKTSPRADALTRSSFIKIWITAKKAKVYEGNNTVIIVDSKLNAMMDTDYIAMSSSLRGSAATKQSQPGIATPSARNDQNAIFKQTILPQIEKDINEGKNFANLRQIYNAIVLGIWFKNKFKESFYKSYLNKDNVKGIDTADKQAKDKIYNLYVEAFTKGVYNYVKKDYNPYAHKITRRQYYSGGGDFTTTEVVGTTSPAEVASRANDRVVSVTGDATPNKSGVTGKLAMLAVAAAGAGGLMLTAPNGAEAKPTRNTAPTEQKLNAYNMNLGDVDMAEKAGYTMADDGTLMPPKDIAPISHRIEPAGTVVDNGKITHVGLDGKLIKLPYPVPLPDPRKVEVARIFQNYGNKGVIEKNGKAVTLRPLPGQTPKDLALEAQLHAAGIFDFAVVNGKLIKRPKATSASSAAQDPGKLSDAEISRLQNVTLLSESDFNQAFQHYLRFPGDLTPQLVDILLKNIKFDKARELLTDAMHSDDYQARLKALWWLTHGRTKVEAPGYFTSNDILRMFSGYENWNENNYDDALSFLKAWYNNFLKTWAVDTNRGVNYKRGVENFMLALCNSSNKRISEAAFKVLDENWWLDEPEAFALAQKYINESDDVYAVAKGARFLVHHDLKAFNDFSNNAPERWRRTIAKHNRDFGALDRAYLAIYDLLKPSAQDKTARDLRLETIIDYGKTGWYRSYTEGVLAQALYDFQDSPEQFTLAAEALGEVGGLETMEYLYRFITNANPALSPEMAKAARATFDRIAERHNKNAKAQWALLAAGHSIHKNKYELAAGGALLALGIYRLLNKSEKEYARRLLSDESISEYVQDFSLMFARGEYSYKQLYSIYQKAKKHNVEPRLVFFAFTKMRRLLIGKNDLTRLGRYLITVGEQNQMILQGLVDGFDAFTDEAELYAAVHANIGDLPEPGKAQNVPAKLVKLLNAYQNEDLPMETRINAAMALGKSGDQRMIYFLFRALTGEINHNYPKGINAVILATSQALTDLRVPKDAVNRFILAQQVEAAYNYLFEATLQIPANINITVIREKLLRLISCIHDYSPTIILLVRYSNRLQTIIGKLSPNPKNNTIVNGLNSIMNDVNRAVNIAENYRDPGQLEWREALSQAWKKRWGSTLDQSELDELWYAHNQIPYLEVKNKLDHVRTNAPRITPDQRAWLIAHQWLGEKPTALGRLVGKVGARLVSQADNRAFKTAIKNLNGANLAKKLEAIAYLSHLNDPRGIIVLFSTLKTVAGKFSLNPFTGKVTQPYDQKQLQDAIQESLEHLGVSKEESNAKISESKMKAYIQFIKTNKDLSRDNKNLASFMVLVTELANADSQASEAFIAYAENLTEGTKNNLKSAVRKAVEVIFAEQQKRLEHLRPLIEAWEKAGWNKLYKEQLEGVWYVHSKMSRGWHTLTPAEKASMQEPGAEAAAKGIKGIISYKGKEHNVYLIHTGELAITECSNDEVKAIFAYLEKNNLFSKGQASWLMDNGWLGEDTTQKLTTPDSENRLLSFIFEVDQVAGHDPQMRPKGYTRHMEAALRWRTSIMESGNVKFEELYVVHLVDEWYDKWAKYPTKNKIEAILKARVSEGSTTQKAQSLRESGILKEDEISWLLENRFLEEDESGPDGNSGPKKNPGALALVPNNVQDGGLTWKTTGIEKYGNGNFYFENIPDLKIVSSMGFVINAITPNKTIGQFLN
jgi:hypothetical protein